MDIIVTFKDGKIGRSTGVDSMHAYIKSGDWDALSAVIVRFAKRHLASTGVDTIIYENHWGIVTAGDRVVAEFAWKEED